LARALAWYDQQRPSLGNRFMQSVRDALARIETNPAAYAVSFESNRTCKTKQFPYLIVYDFDERTIRVYAVVHAASDPQQWTIQD
jgi:hypothetical protein